MRYIYTCIHIYVCMNIYVYMYVCMYVYMRICMNVYICVCMCLCVCIYIYMYVCVYLCILYLYIACMYSLFHLALGNKDGGVQLVFESACCLAWGVFSNRRKDRGVFCVLSIFDAGGSVYGCVCVYTHTHYVQSPHVYVCIC